MSEKIESKDVNKVEIKKRALLFSKKFRKNHVYKGSGDFHSDKGTIKEDVLLNAKPGDELITSTGAKYVYLEEKFSDHYSKLKRLAQIINPKDAGHIIGVVGNDYKRAFDCGAGSGALSIFLAKMNPKAKIFSMDIREDHLNHAKKNAEEFGMKNIEFMQGSIYDGIPKNKIDLLTLDVPEPYKVIPHFDESLEPGAFIVTYVPCTNQVLEFVNNLGDNCYVLKIVEINERYWEAGGKKIRPSTLGPQHTAFMVFVRYLGTSKEE